MIDNEIQKLLIQISERLAVVETDIKFFKTNHRLFLTGAFVITGSLLITIVNILIFYHG